MEWIKNLSNVIEYIERHLDREISYEEAASIANNSKYYFQRIFHYVTGLSLSEYIRRRRMSEAALELQRTDIKVLDVALKYGYSSPTAFNRAFKSVHKVSPMSAKKKGVTLISFPPIEFLIKVKGDTPMSYRIEDKPAFRIAGLRLRITEDMEKNQKIIPDFWNEIVKTKEFSEICLLSEENPNGILGVSVFKDPENIFYYIASATKKDVSEKFFVYEIPASTWVIFENNGHFRESVQSVFNRFYTEWLLGSGYMYAELPDIEVYPIKNEKMGEGSTEVWISIKKDEVN